MWSTPLHLEGAEEEIFYVLAGPGISVQWEGEDDARLRRARGDCLVHLALENAHTLQGGTDGLDVLAFGQRTYAEGDVASARGRGVARRDLGAGRRRGGSPVGARGRGRRRPRSPRTSPRPANDRQRRRRRVRSSATAPRSAAAFATSGGRRARCGRASATRRSFPGKLERAAALPLRRGGDLRRPRGRRRSAPLGARAASTEHPVRAGSVVCRSPRHRGRPRVPWRRRRA